MYGPPFRSNMIDRIIWGSVLLVVGAVAVQEAAPTLTALAIVGTTCFVVVRLVLFYTNRW